MSKYQKYQSMLSKTLQALSDPNRQKIITLLQKQDMPVSDILDNFQITGASLSHHLTVLKNADLISCRRQGQQLIYSLNLSVLEEMMNKITKLLKKEK